MIMMHEVASHGGGMAAASTVHINLFGPHPIVVFGSPEQKRRWIPALIAGTDQCCFGVTEPDAGLNTTAIKTFAEKAPGGYRVRGQKVWTSTAQVATRIMLVARTTRLEDCRRPTDGISIFYTILIAAVSRSSASPRWAARPSTRMRSSLMTCSSRKYCIGEEGKGFVTRAPHSLNPSGCWSESRRSPSARTLCGAPPRTPGSASS